MTIRLITARVAEIVDEHRRGLERNTSLCDPGALSVELAGCSTLDIGALMAASSNLQGVWDEGARLIIAHIETLRRSPSDDDDGGGSGPGHSTPVAPPDAGPDDEPPAGGWKPPGGNGGR